MALNERLQSTLGNAYTIERELGGGGMSRVFVAVDRNLGRPVVVKLLEPDVASGVSLERFAREIKLAATLQHPCIVPVLTSGDANGIPFYTMPLVDGQSLRKRLAAAPIPLAEIIRILRDVASALACAHAHGVVHRDIKPENVLLSGGYAMVTDFGIAKALTAAITDADALAEARASTLTQLGVAIGTPQYMSPEQISGDADVDARADIYSFGCLAYELLAGEPPFGNRSFRQLLIAHLAEVPRPIAERRADVPPALADLVMRCLAKDAVNRPQRADEIVGSLENVSSAATPGEAPTVAPARVEPAVAVLPFANLSSDAENEYLSDGITEEIIGTLAHIPGIRVAGRASSFALKGKRMDPRDAAKQLGVTCVVEGSVRKAGNSVRVSVEMVNAADGFSLWSERFDRDLTDIFAVQDEIAVAIAMALPSKLIGATPAPAVLPAQAPASSADRGAVQVNGEAYALYLRGLHVYRNQVIPRSVPRALELYEQALSLDPALAKAHVAKGMAHHSSTVRSLIAPKEAMPKAAAAAQAALAIDPDSAQAHMLAGYTAVAHDWDWAKAEREFARALELDPNDPIILNRATIFELSRRHDDVCVELSRRAVEIDPLDVWSLSAATAMRLGVGRFSEAVQFGEAVLELSPHHAEAVRYMAEALVRLGRLDEAYAAIAKAVALSNRNAYTLSELARVHGMRGEIDAARACVDELLARRNTEYVSAHGIAVAHIAIGDWDEAIKWFEAAIEERDWTCFLWRSHLGLDDAMRADERIQRLIRRIGIPE